MASPDLSLYDLNRGIVGIKYLNLYLDYAMVLNVEYDGQPDNTLVSMMPEPQQEETRLIDACLAEHREELSIRWLRCPQCGCTESDKRKTTCEECDRPLEAVRVATEESLRREVWKRLRWEIPGFQARSVVPRWLATELYPGRGTPPDPRLELSLVFERILEGMRTTRKRCFRDSWDHLSLGKSVSELLPPRDEPLDVKHYHYRAVRQKLIDGYRWLVIRERQHPDFIEADAQHRSLECFPPAVTLPKAPESQTPAAKRSTERGEGRAKLIGALTKHHQYAEGGCLNLVPIGNNELARLAQVSPSTASEFFEKEFGGHTKYRTFYCGDAVRLVAAIKQLRQEYSPDQLFGRTPPGESEHDDET